MRTPARIAACIAPPGSDAALSRIRCRKSSGRPGLPERDDRLVRPNARWHENLAGGDARPDVRCHVRKTRARLGRGRREKCPREAERVRPRRHQHPDGFLLLCCRGARCKILGFSRLRTHTGVPTTCVFWRAAAFRRAKTAGAFAAFLASWHIGARGRGPRDASAKMGARRVMYWRQPPDRRTMQNYLELARAVSSRLNVLDARETRWSAEAARPAGPGDVWQLGGRSCQLHKALGGR